MSAKINVYAKHGDRWLRACEPDDRDATRWEVVCPGVYPVLTFDNAFRAQEAQRALSGAFEAGHKATMAEFRAFIGVE